MKSIFVVLIILAPTIFFGYLGQPIEMGLSIVAGSVICIFLNLDKVKKFSAGGPNGIEAEMKEVVDEAYATIKILKSLATTLIISSTHQLTYANRLGGMNTQTEQEIKNSLDSIAKDLELEDENLKSANISYHNYKTWDHFGLFAEAIGYSEIIDKPKAKLLYDLIDYTSTNYPDSNTILDLLELSKNDLDQNSKNRLDNYLYYLEHHQLKNPKALDPH